MFFCMPGIQKKEDLAIDYHLSIGDTCIRFFMSDMGKLFDPTLFYELHSREYPEELLGIGTVMKRT